MKCDNLQRYSVDIDYVPNDDGAYMDADEVNEAIAELKQTIDKLVGVKKSAEQILQNLLDCGLIKEWYFNGKFNAVLKDDDPHMQIAELKHKLVEKDKEIALLKERICNGDVSRATWIDACFDKDMEIEELKAENERLKFEPCNDGEKCGAYWKLYAENEKLKATPEQIMKEVFDKVLIYPKEMVRLDDVYKLAVALRATRRALWLARAKRADDRARIFYFNDLETILDIDGYSYDSKKKKSCTKLAARDWRIIWLEVERKCRAKAEQYK